PGEMTPSSQAQLQWPRWGLYERSGGTQGDPVDVPAAAELVQQWRTWRDARKEATKTDAWRQIVKLNADQVFTIGLVGEGPQPRGGNPAPAHGPGPHFLHRGAGAFFRHLPPGPLLAGRKGRAITLPGVGATRGPGLPIFRL